MTTFSLFTTDNRQPNKPVQILKAKLREGSDGKWTQLTRSQTSCEFVEETLAADQAQRVLSDFTKDEVAQGWAHR